jgi:hypothetical protein
MLYREIIAVCSEIHTKHMNIQSAPRSKHTFCLCYKNGKLMLCREIIAVCSEIHPKHTNALWAAVAYPEIVSEGGRVQPRNFFGGFNKFG